MPITPTQGTTNQNTSLSLKSLNISADDFLKLLVAQIQNQDPMQPLDDKEFITQTAQFTQLEETRSTNQWLEKIASPDNSGAVVATAHLIGKDVKVGYGSSQVSGRVSAVCVEEGVVKLLVGGVLVNAADVVEVKEGVQV